MKPALQTAILLNDYCYINGGASRVAIDEAVALADAGVRVVFLGATGPICAELSQAQIEVICLNQPELLDVRSQPGVALQGLWNAEAARQVTALLQQHNPQHTTVHLHGYTKSLTSSPARAALDAGFELVCTLHDFFPACPNGAFFDYVKREPCTRRALSLDCVSTNCDKRRYAHKLYRVARTLVQNNMGGLPSRIRHFISVSSSATTRLKPYLPADAQYYDLENIIEVARQPAIDSARNRDIVAVGRLDVEKGVEILLEATRRSGQSLTLVGDGPLRAIAETAPHCRVTGWLSPQQVYAELALARCLVFPSLWYETYGLVVTEAAALGVPAIVSDISAAAERVTDGVHGWLTRAGSVEDLVRCLEYTRNNDLVRSAGREAYARFWAAPPTRQHHVAQLRKIYEQMLAQRRPPLTQSKRRDANARMPHDIAAED